MTPRVLAPILLILTGCAMPQPVSHPVLLPDAAGLGIADSPLRLDFGRAPAGVIAALTRELGPPEALATATCPVGIEKRLRWDDLELTFTREQFVGWRKSGAQAGDTCV